MTANPLEFAASASCPPLAWLEHVNRQTLVTHMLAATVHDVNNTLQVVSGAAEVLAMDPSPEAVAKRTEAIVGHARHATVALHTLMAFARGTVVSGDRARLKVLAEQAVGLRQHALRKARVTASVTGDDIEVRVASPVVLQIVLNLLLNAEHALAGHAGAAVAIAVGAEGEHATLVVTDNGPGVACDLSASLGAWPPSEVRGPTPTLGLGLLVSRMLAERGGGSLRYAPACDGGATFCLSLPRPHYS